jgi:hypothetical protein
MWKGFCVVRKRQRKGFKILKAKKQTVQICLLMLLKRMGIAERYILIELASTGF